MQYKWVTLNEAKKLDVVAKAESLLPRLRPNLKAQADAKLGPEGQGQCYEADAKILASRKKSISFLF